MNAATSLLQIGSGFEGRYEIELELGSGSFGRVYRARQLSTGQPVAIKLLSPRDGTASSSRHEADRFRRETQIGAALSHPNIVRLMDSGETTEGQLYAVFEYVPGETLAQTLEQERSLSISESVRLMTQVLDALAAAHAQGIVHRDLKPANLMLSGTGVRRNALVLDFGLGGLAEDRRRKEWQTLTQTREFLGTPLYASPEQLAGEAATPRSDLYAWGLIFLECLAGGHPFAEEGAVARLLTGGGAVEIPEWLRGHRLGALLAAVTELETAKRDVSLESLVATLDEIARGELPVAPEVSAAPAPLTESGERRHLTVMFCDLVGSTALGQRLDAEAYSRVVQAYHARATEAVERYGGLVGQYQGDGLLVYFGYPQAHEDDAERAVRAGREILREFQTLNPRLEAEHGVEIKARVGIHTGPAVVGEMGGEKPETMALGDTLNVAARLEAFAEPDTVVISDATRRLVAGLFVTEDLGTPALKGISQPIGVHQVLQSSGVTSRLDRAPALSPFVGREEELGLLWSRFQRAEEGQGQAVLISGEAGIGKSRLMHQLRERLREAPHTWLECRSSPYTEKSAFHPVIELLEQVLGFAEPDTSDQKLERLERGLAHAGIDSAETVPLFASLLSLRLPERYAPLEISPQLQRQKTLVALLAWLLALGEKQPVVLLLEDLHWIDPSTLEWVGMLIEQCPTASVLVLLTFRPEFEPPWPGRAHLLPVTLSRLSREHAKQLVAGAVSSVPLSDALVDTLAQRADGVPLFAEELAKDVVDSGAARDGAPAELAIPETLQDSLMARLDRLGDAKQVAQLGAVIGREFPYALLEAVAPLQPGELVEGLGRLVEAELAYQRGIPPQATYTFKHALVQDEAYASLLEGQRREIHGRIADAIVERTPEAAEQQPELVAGHLNAGPEPVRAIEYWQRAGDLALARLAGHEAGAHYTRGLALLEHLPDRASRDRCELPLQLGMGAARAALGQWGDPETAHTWRRALELAEALGDAASRCGALWGLSAYHQSQSEFRESGRLARELRDAARKLGDIWVELAGWNQLINAHALLGDHVAAVELLDQMLARDPVSEPDPGWYAYGCCQRIVARGWAATALAKCGYLERAVAVGEEAIAMARELPSPVDFCFAAGLANGAYMTLGEPEPVAAHAKAALALADEAGGFFLLLVQMNSAWADAALGRGGEATADACLAALDRAAAQMPDNIATATHSLWMSADTLRRVGRLDEAEELAGNALALAEAKEQHFHTAEIHLTLGEIRLAREEPDPAEAERCFERALAVARSQQARASELRAATSLARLLSDRGERDAARALLQPVYDWFTEGFDTRLLRDARALLAELAA